MSAGCSTSPWNESVFESQRASARAESEYLPWKVAKSQILERCQNVTAKYQGHSRVVSVGFDDEEAITTITPQIDQVLGVVEGCHGDFDNVVIVIE